MPESPLSCLRCRERARHCRGLCVSCERWARQQIAEGKTTWEQLVARGLALPARRSPWHRWG
jgi:hypothetical protein